MATGARQDLKDSLGPELGDLNISDLDPRSFVKRNLFDPIDDEVNDVQACGRRQRRRRCRREPRAADVRLRHHLSVRLVSPGSASARATCPAARARGVRAASRSREG